VNFVFRSAVDSFESFISVHQQPVSAAPQMKSSPQDSQTEGSLYFSENSPRAFFNFINTLVLGLNYLSIDLFHLAAVSSSVDVSISTGRDMHG